MGLFFPYANSDCDFDPILERVMINNYQIHTKSLYMMTVVVVAQVLLINDLCLTL